MILTYQGGNSFKVSQGDLALSLNPQNNRSKSDVALFSEGRHLEGGDFVIAGPGEYEVKDITVKGFPSEGAADRINTIYMIGFEGLTLCTLGALSNAALPAGTLESLDDIDILFVPVETLGPAAANKLAVSLEPRLIVPMTYTQASLAQFLKEAGEEKAAPLDKLVVKKKDLEGKEADLVVLTTE